MKNIMIFIIFAITITSCNKGGGKSSGGITGDPSLSTVSTPSFSLAEGSYSHDINIEITCATAGVQIFYTLDGTIPTNGSTLYSGPVNISGKGTSVTLKAMAAKEGLENSAIEHSFYVISYSALSTPSFSLVEGSYSHDISIEITCATAGAQIFYTLDGTIPTNGSTLYSGPINITGSGTSVTLKAIAVKEGLENSAVKDSFYVIDYSKVSTPQFSLPGGNYNYDLSITVSSTTPDARIYYTTNGSDPTELSTPYTSGIPVQGIGTKMTIKTIAFKPGMEASQIAAAVYTRTGVVAKNAVGTTDSTTLRALDYTPADSNSIFVAKIGSDTTGTGTSGNPVTSVTKAITLVDASRTRVVIMDSGIYQEKGFQFTGNLRGLYAASGQKPELNLLANYGFFDETIDKSGVVFKNTKIINPAAAVMPNGHIVLAYITNWDTPPNTGNFIVLDPNNNYSVVKQETAFTTQAHGVGVTRLKNGNVLIAYSSLSDNKGKFRVYDVSYNLVGGEYIFNQNVTNDLSVTTLQNGNIFFSYSGTSQVGRFIVMDPSFNIIKTETVFNNYVMLNQAATLANGNVIIAFADFNNGPGKVLILDKDDFHDVSGKITFRAQPAFNFGTAVLLNGNIMLIYTDASSQQAYYMILNPALNTVKSETAITGTHNFYNYGIATMQNGSVFFPYADVAQGNIGNYTVITNTYRYITVSGNAEINGIKISTDNDPYHTRIFQVNNARMALKYCDIVDFTQQISYSPFCALFGSGEIDFSNSRIYGGNYGISLTGSRVDIRDSQFYNNSGTAVTIDGAAVMQGDISINHTDFFSNSGGVRLKNNSGTNEVMKNSIFYNNSSFSISADSAIMVNNSLLNNPVQNILMGTGTLISNPLYKDEGASSPYIPDLNLRSILEGFVSDSPGIGLGDDFRNAGSYDVEYLK